ncbi:MAG: type II secretion system protein [Gammaproteobacteria bacterium]|nr:type II secretion system protein [Gammaproteobacteria bacterium]
MARFDRNRGVTLPEMGLYVGLLAIVGLFVVGQWGNIQSGVRAEQAYAEIVRVKTAAEAYRSAPAQAGSYAGISVEVLADNGYNVEPFTDGADENVYGLDVAVASSSDVDASITYQFDVEADCEQLVDRLTDAVGVKGTPACSGTGPHVLTFVIE